MTDIAAEREERFWGLSRRSYNAISFSGLVGLEWTPEEVARCGIDTAFGFEGIGAATILEICLWLTSKGYPIDHRPWVYPADERKYRPKIELRLGLLPSAT